MRLVRFALLATIVPTLIAATPAMARTESFQSPSGNIACMYSTSGGPGAFVRCDVLSLNDVGFTLDRRHKAKRIGITDSVVDPNGARKLRYGASRRFGSFRCTSRRSGLTCRSTRSSHGFTLSRERQRVF
jgi:hypothetical protein